MSGGVVARWIALVRRRWPWGLGVGLVVLLVSAAVALLPRSVYRAEARLRLGEAPPAPGVSPTSSVLGLFRMGGDPFANDLQLLESRTLAERVVSQVGLNVTVLAPRGWFRDSLFTAVRGAGADRKGGYELTWQPDGGVTVHQLAPTDSAIGRFAAGETLRFAGVELVPAPRRPHAPDRIRVSVQPVRAALKSATGRINVERTQREANVVRVRFEDTDPRLAEQTVDAAVAAFTGLRTTIMKRESGETVDSLRGVADHTRAELAAAEQAVQEMQERSGLVAPDAQNAALVERMVQVESDLEAARQERDAVAVLLERVQSAPDAATAWTVLVAHPRFIDNETMVSLLGRLTALEEQRTALAAKRTEANVEYRTVVEQIAYLDASLRSLVSSYRDGLTERITALEGTVSTMRSTLAAVPARAVELARRQRQARVLSEVLIATEQRLRQEELREALSFSNVQVIDPPELEYRPVWPRPKLGMAIGLLLSLCFGMLAMVVVDSADATVRSARELSTLAGAPVLAAFTVNGRIAPPAESEATALLALGHAVGPVAPPLVVATVDSNGGQLAVDQVMAVLAAAGWDRAGREVRVSPPVVSYAAARQALTQGGPLLLALVQGRTAIPDVERAVRLLREAGGAAAGMIVVCRSDVEAGELWS